MNLKIQKMKMIYEPPVAETHYVILEGIIASSRSGITVKVEDMENVTLGDDGFGNNDILLNF